MEIARKGPFEEVTFRLRVKDKKLAMQKLGKGAPGGVLGREQGKCKGLKGRVGLIKF